MKDARAGRAAGRRLTDLQDPERQIFAPIMKLLQMATNTE
jgi:hypothetical protein